MSTCVLCISIFLFSTAGVPYLQYLIGIPLVWIVYVWWTFLRCSGYLRRLCIFFHVCVCSLFLCCYVPIMFPLWVLGVVSWCMCVSYADVCIFMYWFGVLFIVNMVLCCWCCSLWCSPLLWCFGSLHFNCIYMLFLIKKHIIT